MNFHAEKVDYSRDTPDRDNENPEFGGVLVEFHTCPICRFVLERPAG